jgi:type II secretory pathway component PulM
MHRWQQEHEATMNDTHLDDSLSRLRSAIQTLDVADEDARRRLEKLVEDIEKARAGPKVALEDQPLGERLKASTLDFEVSHPRLSTLMNEVMEKLSSMGI